MNVVLLSFWALGPGHDLTPRISNVPTFHHELRGDSGYAGKGEGSLLRVRRGAAPHLVCEAAVEHLPRRFEPPGRHPSGPDAGLLVRCVHPEPAPRDHGS